MTKQLFTLLIIVLGVHALPAQYDHNWCFGDSMRLELNTSPSKVIL